jgi:hypothetical protein
MRGQTDTRKERKKDDEDAYNRSAGVEAAEKECRVPLHGGR